MDDGSLTRQQVEAIIERALELDETRSELSVEDLRRIASEVGISSGALERATREVLGADSRADGTAGDEPRERSLGTRSAVLLEVFVAFTGGAFAAFLAGVGLAPVAFLLVILIGLVLLLHRDRGPISRFVVEWVVLCGTFVGVLHALGFGEFPPSTRFVLFLGGLLLAAIVAYAEERGRDREEDGPPLLAGPGQA